MAERMGIKYSTYVKWESKNETPFLNKIKAEFLKERIEIINLLK